MPLLFASLAHAQAKVPVLEPSANQVRVGTVARLVAAIANAVPGQTIMLEDGTYDVSAVEPLRFRTANVALYGASRDPAKVILKGQGFTCPNIDEEMIKIESTGFTLAYVTMRDVRANGLKIQTGGNDDIMVHNVNFIDICERSIKSPEATPSKNGTVRYCLFEQKTPITADIPNLHFDGDYIAGMDMMKIEGWKIHDNTFRNIKGMHGGGRAALFFWHDCKNITVERNIFIGCDRAIAFGNPSSAMTDMTGGIARNNFISAGADISIEVCNTASSHVYHNTIYSANPGFSRTFSFTNCGAGNMVENNLVMGKLAITAGTAPENAANLFLSTAAQAQGWFVNPAAADLRLTALATSAINKGVPLAEVADDINLQLRDRSPDIGADELDVATALVPGPVRGDRNPGSNPSLRFSGSFFQKAGTEEATVDGMGRR